MLGSPLAYVQQTNLTAAINPAQGFNRVATVSIPAGQGGSGYKVGDVLTIAGGTVAGDPTNTCRVIVTQIDSTGQVIQVAIQNNGLQAGYYSANPTSPNTPTGGNGTGCKLNLTFASNVPPAGTTLLVISVEAQSVRYRDDGVAPTATVGMLIPASTLIQYDGPPTMIQFIAATAGAILNVTFYKT